ncbi:MAG: hypothetical protein Q9P14_19325 [candidate division KSB1 bacterium]|nr:hypothetical protein [candidate division KSB1 bacterium]MDQ7063689.1 hypothetical protein [candidate division KSB1 bacterium]
MMLNARTYLATFIFIISVLPNACLIEQVLAWAVDVVQTDSHHAEKDHHSNSAPSHRHDEEGHESDFCCDNPLYFYFASQKKQDTNKVYAVWQYLHLNYLYDEIEKRYSFLASYFTYCSQPIALRNRDRFALTSLLRSPPLFSI